MTAAVLPFGRRKDDGEKPIETETGGPHLRGPARCLGCSHEWQGLAPVGIEDPAGLECPSCSALKGVFLHFVSYSDCPNWKCLRCNSFLFSLILAKGDVPTLACCCCGNLMNALDLFNKPTS